MAGKSKPVIIEAKDFRVFLASRMGALKISVAQMAEELDITPTAVYALLTGDLAPSDDIVGKLGLRPAYVLEVQPEASNDPPARTGRGKK